METEPDNSNQIENIEATQTLVSVYRSLGGGETLEELRKIAENEETSLESLLTDKVAQNFGTDFATQIVEQNPELADALKDILPQTKNNDGQSQKQKETQEQKQPQEQQEQQSNEMTDFQQWGFQEATGGTPLSETYYQDLAAESELNKQEKLANELRTLEKTQKDKLLELESSLNSLSIDLPEDSSPELKEKYDKQFNDIFKVHDEIAQKYSQTTEHLSTVEENLKHINNLITEKNKTETTDSEKSKEIEQQVNEFKADSINLKDLQEPSFNFQDALSKLPKNPNNSGQQVSWANVVEKREKLKPTNKDESPKLKTEETNSLEETNNSNSAPSTPLATEQPISFKFPNSLDSTSQFDKLKTFNLQTNTQTDNLLSKKSDLNEESKNLETDYKFSYNNDEYNNFKTTKLESPNAFKLDLDNKQTFQPISDLSSNDSILPTAGSEGSEKLDLILGDTGLTNQLLTQLIQTLPTLLAGSTMANMAGSQGASPGPQSIPISVPSSAANKSTITPSIPNIPGYRAGIGVA
jgi:hypothetical protein